MGRSETTAPIEPRRANDCHRPLAVRIRPAYLDSSPQNLMSGSLPRQDHLPLGAPEKWYSGGTEVPKGAGILSRSDRIQFRPREKVRSGGELAFEVAFDEFDWGQKDVALAHGCKPVLPSALDANPIAAWHGLFHDNKARIGKIGDLCIRSVGQLNVVRPEQFHFAIVAGSRELKAHVFETGGDRYNKVTALTLALHPRQSHMILTAAGEHELGGLGNLRYLKNEPATRIVAGQIGLAPGIRV